MADIVSPTTAAPGAGLRAAAWLTFALLVVVMFGSAFIRFAHRRATPEAASTAARWSIAWRRSSSCSSSPASRSSGGTRCGRRRVSGARRAGRARVALTFLGRFTPCPTIRSSRSAIRSGARAGRARRGGSCCAASPERRGAAHPLLGGVLVCGGVRRGRRLVIWGPGLVVGLAVQFARDGRARRRRALLYRTGAMSHRDRRARPRAAGAVRARDGSALRAPAGRRVLLILNREPFPLYRVLERNGYAWRTASFPDGRFEILISERARPA